MTDGKSGTMDVNLTRFYSLLTSSSVRLSGYQSDSSSSASSEFEKLERTDEAAAEPTAELPPKSEEPKEEDAGDNEKDATLESPHEEAETDAPKAEPKVEEEAGDRPTETAEEPTDEAAGGGEGDAEIHPPAIGDQSISQAMDESGGHAEIAAQLSAHFQTAADRLGRLFANSNVRIAAGVLFFAIVGYFVVQFGILPRMQQNDLQHQVDELQSKIKQYEQLLDAQEQAAKKLEESRFLFGKCLTFRFGLLERLGLLPAGGFRVCF
ncbi:hypothetical protein M3Y99_01408200 [Aphelenchoides fujianensis]|nr:hypothetical protein M3Y99_01408200 [Aphelenchoides fujianensis]